MIRQQNDKSTIRLPNEILDRFTQPFGRFLAIEAASGAARRGFAGIAPVAHFGARLSVTGSLRHPFRPSSVSFHALVDYRTEYSTATVVEERIAVR